MTLCADCVKCGCKKPLDRAALIAVIRSKAVVKGHDSWEGGYYHLSNAEEIADAIIATTGSRE